MERRLYSIWHNMKTRCYNRKAEHYNCYGGRGITVCPEWRRSYAAFETWAMANGYSDDLTLDRKDNEGHYCPENCRWVDMYHQNNNTRKNHYITHDGETKTAAEWARMAGIHRCVLNNRIRRGWDFERAIGKRQGEGARRKDHDMQREAAEGEP